MVPRRSSRLRALSPQGAVSAQGGSVAPGSHRDKPCRNSSRPTQARGLRGRRIRNLHPPPMAGRRCARDSQDAPWTRQSRPNGPRKHEDPGSADRNRHEPQEAGGRNRTFGPIDHHMERGSPRLSADLKQLFQQPPVDRFANEPASRRRDRRLRRPAEERGPSRRTVPVGSQENRWKKRDFSRSLMAPASPGRWPIPIPASMGRPGAGPIVPRSSWCSQAFRTLQ